MTPPGSDSGFWTPVHRFPAGSRRRRPARPRAEHPPGPARAPAARTASAAGTGAPARRNAASPVSRALGGVLDHRLLDRLIRGRMWIAFVAFALIGIVAMQLAQLPLNTRLGQTLNNQQLLTSENSQLRLQVSALSSADRIEALASGLGMVPAAPGAIRFLDGARPPSTAAVERALATPVSRTGATGPGGVPAGG